MEYITKEYFLFFSIATKFNSHILIINIYLLFYLLISVSCKEKDQDIEKTAKIFSSIIGDAGRALKDTTRFVKNHKFNPKYYKNGWRGEVNQV